MEFSQWLHTHFAVRQFSPDRVPVETILAIIATARRAQSSKNCQPWTFLVIQNKETLASLSLLGDYAWHLADASFAVALVGERQSMWNSFDLGQAAAVLQLTAWEHGIGACIAAIFQVEEAKRLLHIPEERNFFAAVSFGFPDENARPARMGGRKSIDALIKWERWE